MTANSTAGKSEWPTCPVSSLVTTLASSFLFKNDVEVFEIQRHVIPEFIGTLIDGKRGGIIALNTGTVPTSTDHCPDKSPDLLKRTQKYPQERILERKRSRSRERYISYDF